jgi:hypothetical protein
LNFEWTEDDIFLSIISDEATFRLCGKVTRYRTLVLGSEIPHTVVEYVRISPTIKVSCTLSSAKVYGPLFFGRKSVHENIYHNNLELSQILKDKSNVVSQHERAPQHIHEKLALL